MKRRWVGLTARVIAVLLAVVLGRDCVWGQVNPASVLIDSYETGVGTVTAFNQDGGATATNSVYLNHAQSSVLPTHGTSSMLLDMYGTFAANAADPRGSANGWAFQRTATSGDADLAVYNAFDAVSADPSKWLLQMDVAMDATSWVNAVVPTSGPPAARTAWSFLNLGISTDFGFAQVQISPNLHNQQGRFRLRVPMSALENASTSDTIFVPGSTFYQFLLGANNKFQTPAGTSVGTPPGPTTGSGAKIFIDNMRFVAAPPVLPTKLFDWEGPGNFELWSDAGLNPDHANKHKHTLVSVGATMGTQALRIDNRQEDPTWDPPGPGYAFFWGSQFERNAATDADPVAAQTQITSFVNAINKASSISFDVTFSDPASIDSFTGAPIPTFIGFALHITDRRTAGDSFFQADGNAFSAAEVSNLYVSGQTVTYEFPMSLFSDKSTLALGSMAGKLDPNSPFLRMGLAINADGGVVANIDNFRVNIPTDLDADYDRDGDVDSADLAKWKTDRNAANGQSDADYDGITDGNDLLIWQRQKGNDGTPAAAAAGAVPEPLSAALLAVGLLLAGRTRRCD